MNLDRREFLQLAAGSATGAWLASSAGISGAVPRPIKAIAFDGFAIFDPRPVFALAETLFPGRGSELSGVWRTRQFEYQWLRALSGRYKDFLGTTGDALAFAARSLRLELPGEKRARLMDAYATLPTWPDVAPAVAALRAAGLRLAFLSNMTREMLLSASRSTGLDGAFEHVLSTDAIRTYKPDPRAYRLAIDAFRLEAGEILFASFAGWDAAGAKGFGYPTFWVNRLDAPAEDLGESPDATGHDLGALVRFVRER